MAEDATIAIIVAAAIIVEDFFIIVFVSVIIFLLFIFVLRMMLPSYGDKHGDKFRVWIPSLDSKSGIEQPIFISSCYYNNQCLLEDGAAA